MEDGITRDELAGIKSRSSAFMYPKYDPQIDSPKREKVMNIIET
jgi:hypothetical protein